jgi:hypothetical protein
VADDSRLRRHPRHRAGWDGSSWGRRARRCASGPAWAERRANEQLSPRSRRERRARVRLQRVPSRWALHSARRTPRVRARGLRARTRRVPLPSRPSWPWLPSRPFRLSRPRREPHGEVRRRRRVGGCGRPERLRSTRTGSMRRYLVSERVRATPCSSARALLTARALVFSLAPKRSLTSRTRTFGGHSFLFFHNYGLFPIVRPRITARSSSPTADLSARAT